MDEWVEGYDADQGHHEVDALSHEEVKEYDHPYVNDNVLNNDTYYDEGIIQNDIDDDDDMANAFNVDYEISLNDIDVDFYEE